MSQEPKEDDIINDVLTALTNTVVFYFKKDNPQATEEDLNKFLKTRTKLLHEEAQKVLQNFVKIAVNSTESYLKYLGELTKDSFE